jgi:oxamate amidohydrolase
MLNTPRAMRGMVTAPHHLAAQSGLAVLREGGNAIEAMIAAAATIAVVYPHMNSIGGDGFWLIGKPGMKPIAIDACGRTGTKVSTELYTQQGLDAIPTRGPLAANTVAGTVSGWGEAERLSHAAGGHLPIDRLLEDAIYYAESGVPVTAGQTRLTDEKRDEMHASPGFSQLFAPGGQTPQPGTQFKNQALAESLRAIALEGPEGFYRGELAKRICADLARAGSPLTSADLATHQALQLAPLSVTLSNAQLFNLPPPTQGISSLQILALFDRLNVAEAESFAHIHGLVEATKQAFIMRNAEVTDPAHMRCDPAQLLSDATLDRLSANIDPQRALAWPVPSAAGDTIWMGAVDRSGLSVSFIQSIYWEFGSGVVLEDSGIQWQNRGSSFDLRAHAVNALEPGRKPFHTLNPAMAYLDDGRILTYGTMGGEGQPQTQAAVFSRYALYKQPLQAAITAPRWLLGRTWGEQSTNLKLESRFDPALIESLRNAGHDVEVVTPFTDMMGHAGAIALHPDGVLEGATDPRSDGGVAAF